MFVHLDVYDQDIVQGRPLLIWATTLQLAMTLTEILYWVKGS